MTNVTYDDSTSSGEGKIKIEVPTVRRVGKSPLESPLDGPDEYTKRTTKRGREMYFLNGKLISKDFIPDGQVVKDMDEVVEQPGPANLDTVELSNKECLWQDGPGDHMRFAAGRMVYLCEDHYIQMNLGKIVHRLQERAEQERADERERNTAEDSPSETPTL